jgi:hypothetical protein
MTPKVFVSLWVAAIICVIAAGTVYFANNSFAPVDEAGDPFLPQVIAQAEDIGGMEVVSGGETLILDYKDGLWTLPSRGGYPADITKVRDLVIALAQMRTLERKTAITEKYGLLELGDPAGNDSKSTQVTLKTKDGKDLASIILGRVKPGLLGGAGAATYVRLRDDPQTWLVSGNANTAADITAWVDRAIYKLNPDKITKISVAHPDGASVSLFRTADGYAVPDAADPAKVKDKPALKLEISDYATIELNDVRKAKSGLTPVATGTVEADNVVLQVQVFADGKEFWVAIMAQGESDAAKALNARVSGWHYKINENKAKALNKTSAHFEK